MLDMYLHSFPTPLLYLAALCFPTVSFSRPARVCRLQLPEFTISDRYPQAFAALASNKVPGGQSNLDPAISAFTSEIKFEPREATIEHVHRALFRGNTTCRDIVSNFLARIEAFNQDINAIITMNPRALDVADELDRHLAEGEMLAKLFCVPILVKDNVNTKDMPTTAGCLALADLRPSQDAPSVHALIDAGAIILGKTNLHEMALEGLTVSSLGGQTLNPWDLTRTPGGSSGGSGAAVAASICVFSIGTDTMNSLRSPASANGLFSLRPSWGLVSRTGVVPLSYLQDTIGPIARTVQDLATAFEVMVPEEDDPLDLSTGSVPRIPASVVLLPNEPYEYSLIGMRFGVLESFFDWSGSAETTPVNNVVADFLAKLQSAGAELVPIRRSPLFDPAALAAHDVQKYEWRQLLNEYLGDLTLNGSFPKTFDELYASDDFLIIPAQHAHIQRSKNCSRSDPGYRDQREARTRLRSELEKTFGDLDLDFMLYPEQRNLVVPVGAASQYRRNGHLAVVTGSPVLTIPAGWTATSESAPRGLPVGVEMLGRRFGEQDLLYTGALIEGLLDQRRTPELVDHAVEPKAYQRVPEIEPNAWNIPSTYPLGVY